MFRDGIEIICSFLFVFFYLIKTKYRHNNGEDQNSTWKFDAVNNKLNSMENTIEYLKTHIEDVNKNKLFESMSFKDLATRRYTYFLDSEFIHNLTKSK